MAGSDDVQAAAQNERPPIEHGPSAEAVLFALPDAVLSTDPTGTILSWNPAAARLFGYSARDAGRLNVIRLFEPLAEDQVQAALAGVAGQLDRRDLQLTAMGGDGGTFDAELTLAPLVDQAGGVRAIWWVVRDITERRTSERLADAETAVTRALIEGTSEADVIARVLEGVGEKLGWAVADFWRLYHQDDVLVCSAFWTSGHFEPDVLEKWTSLRFQRGEGLPGRAWLSGLPQWTPDLAADLALQRSDMARRQGLRGTLAFPIYAGRDLVGVIEFFTLDLISPKPPLLAVLSRIGSELGQYISRLRAEELLRGSEERYRTLADTASDAIVTIDVNSAIRYANAATEKMFGYRPEDLVGKRLTILMPERLRASHEAGFGRYLRTSQKNIPWTGVQLPGLHRNGDEIPLEVSFGEFEVGGERAFTGIIRDISERVRQQQELEQAAAELEVTVEELQARTDEAEAAARAKTEFLAAMSHELRTPLQAVIGYAGLLGDGVQGELSEEQMRSIDRIKASAEHLLGLIDQVLEISRSEIVTLELRKEPVDLCAVVSEAAELVRPRAEEKHLELIVGECPAERLRSLPADAGRVRQIVLNLLSNAIKFTARGRIEIHFEELDGKAVIEVFDTGMGIPPGHIDAVFRPFFQSAATLSQRFAGIGLGLSISRELANAMGGDIEVQSELGKGSCFTFWLPLEDG